MTTKQLKKRVMFIKMFQNYKSWKHKEKQRFIKSVKEKKNIKRPKKHPKLREAFQKKTHLINASELSEIKKS